MIAGPLRIAVAGGRRGAGTSFVARGLACFFARTGKRAALFDFSGDAAPLSALSGHDEWRLEEEGGVARQTCGVEGLVFLHAPGSFQRLLAEHLDASSRRDFDVLVADIPCAATGEQAALLFGADIPLLVTAPGREALHAALESAARAFFAWVDRLSEERWSYAAAPPRPGRDGMTARFLVPRDVLAGRADEPYRALVREALGMSQLGIVVNGVADARGAAAGPAAESFARKVLCLPLVSVGSIEHDEVAAAETRAARLAGLAHPDGKSAQDIEKIGRRFITCPDIRLVRPAWTLGVDEEEETYYSILQAGFSTPEFEIKDNHRRLVALLSEGSDFHPLVVDRGVTARYLALMDQALQTLGDRMRRAGYDRILGERLRTVPEDEADGGAVAAAPGKRGGRRRARLDERKVSGRYLKGAREKMGLSIQDIAAVTRIGAPYLMAIEEDNYVDLPQEVYLRGFLQEIARILQLDPESVAGAYLRRMRGGLRED